jgi:formate dehydrogenase iron-sulfur subunit
MSKNLIALQNKFLGHGTTIYDVLARLHEKQGFISDDDIAALAREHNLPPAHVRAVAKFYDELNQHEPASRSLKLCNGEACRAAGCDALVDRVSGALGAELGQVSAAGVRVEHVSCLGYCGLGPSAMVDGQPVSLAEPVSVEAVLRDLAGGEAHGLPEPINAIYPPATGEPCVLLRYAGADVVSLHAARERGIYQSLERAVTQLTPQAVLDEVKASGLRGRGGAGFPTGVKLQTVRDTEPVDGSGRRFVVVNFDEGDAGSYIDKELIERDPHTQIEGILLACFATGAQRAFLYARYEYPRARAVLARALDEARAAGMVGTPLFGVGPAIDITVVRGQGAYICGEETSLLRSLEGLPGLVSIRPPFPAQQGLWGCPTAVNNVETLHNLPWIVEHGGGAYARIGVGRSRGTKLVSLNTRVARPGVYEVPFGTTLRQILELAGGMAAGHRCVGVQVGGPLGGILPASKLDTPLDFEAVAAAGGIVGHAGMVFYSQHDDLFRLARGLMQFCAVESCGKCFPCRIGAVRGTELFDQMIAGGVTEPKLSLLRELCETMTYGSLCAMGSMTPAPVLSVLDHFPEAVDRYRRS